MKSALVMGMHSKERFPSAYDAGPCIVCDEAVYLSSATASGELGVMEYKELVAKKVVAMECFSDILMQFLAVITMPLAMREVLVKEVVKMQERMN